MAETRASKNQISSELVDDEEYLGEEEEEIPEFERETCAEPLETLIDKNTESFKCLGQLVLSRSSLLRHPLYHFPPLEDPGIDAAFISTVREEQIDYIGVDKYKSLCKDFKIMTLSRVVKSLETPSLNLRYYSLSHKQLKAISKTLRNNLYVKDLNLEENYMDVDTVHYLGEMLRDNSTLEILNLRECRIGPEGANELSEGIETTQTLVELDLSCNNLGAEGIKNLQEALKENCTIKKLNLSKNALGDDSIPYLAAILSDNYSLEDLDLSWNTINSPQAWKQLANEGLIPNKDLRILNISWNAISSKGAMKFLMKYTKETETLEYLDLSNNMLKGEVVRMLKGLIMKNTTLLGLNIGFNQLTSQDAQMLIELLLLPGDKRPKLEELNMDNVYVKKNFLGLKKRAERLNKKVTIGGVLGNWIIKGPDIPKLLFDRARLLAMKPKKKKLQRDFSHFIFALPETPMNQTDFTDLVKKFKMKMVDKDLVEALMKNFKFKKRGVDPVAMKERYLELYPDAEPPPKKQKKKKGKKGKKDSEGEEEGWDQGEEEWEEEEVEEWSQFETWKGPGDEEDEDEEVEGEDEEQEEEGEIDRKEDVEKKEPIEVAHGESVTDVIAQLGDVEENVDVKNVEQESQVNEEKDFVEKSDGVQLEVINEDSEG